MAETKKYISLDRLTQYHGENKKLITDTAAATLTSAQTYADGLAVNYDAAGSAEAVQTYVGTIPEGATSTNVVDYIQEKTANIATSDTLQDLTDRVDAVEDDYLKAADKTELQGSITTNAEAIAAVKEDVDAFFADADLTESAKDTLKELQEYIASDETGAAAMTASIQQNSNDIEAIDGRIDTIEGKVTTWDAAEGNAKTYADGLNTAMDTRVTAVETGLAEMVEATEDEINGLFV